MNKADKILIEIENYYAKEFPATMEMRIHFKTLIQKYADEQSREEAIKLLPWYEGTRHKHKGKTWIDIYDDGIKWIKEQEEQK